MYKTKNTIYNHIGIFDVNKTQFLQQHANVHHGLQFLYLILPSNLHRIVRHQMIHAGGLVPATHSHSYPRFGMEVLLMEEIRRSPVYIEIYPKFQKLSRPHTHELTFYMRSWAKTLAMS